MLGNQQRAHQPSKPASTSPTWRTSPRRRPFLFIAFRVPYSPAIGVKLISTPWTDQNLEYAEGITAEQLRQEHRSKGMPDDLANILELAGQADVRILILDADAPVLPGLPLAEP
jgi:hypothetical protein